MLSISPTLCLVCKNLIGGKRIKYHYKAQGGLSSLQAVLIISVSLPYCPLKLYRSVCRSASQMNPKDEENNLGADMKRYLIACALTVAQQTGIEPEEPPSRKVQREKAEETKAM